MPAQTSLETYSWLLDKGYVGQSQGIILGIIATFGPLTSLEIVDEHLGAVGFKINSVVGRVNELVKLGAVVAHDTRTCSRSGHKATAWAFNPALTPATVKKPESKDTELARLRRRVKELEAEVAQLSRQPGQGNLF